MDLPINLKDLIRTIPDYPKEGIMFRDITTLMQHPAGFRRSVDELVQPFAGSSITRVAGIEARGFILGGAVAHQLSAGFVAVRKKGKLPWQTISVEYELEYGTDEVEIHIDSIDQGDQILIIDDLIATGGTAAATTQLMRDAGGDVVGASFIVDLPDLGGRARLEAMGVPVRTLMSFEGE
ncbi:MAG: adenine phosphoribosyltransferase [Alphaproteobacteria bacterium]